MAAKKIPGELAGFGGRLARARNLKGRMTQTELGEAVGVTQGYISHIENGGQSPGDLPLALVLGFCEVLECRLDWLVYGVRPIYDDPQLGRDVG